MGRRGNRPPHRGRAHQADHSPRHLDLRRGVHRGRGEGSQQGGRASDPAADIEPDQPHRGHAARCGAMVEGQGADRDRHPGTTRSSTRASLTQIGEANNALLYPGLGLGTIVSGAPPRDRRHAAGGGRSGGRPGRCDPSRERHCCRPVVNLRASSATVAAWRWPRQRQPRTAWPRRPTTNLMQARRRRHVAAGLLRRGAYQSG